ncbi:anti-phage dCTP deaminase [Marinobacter nauticus]|uniref:anti-phage dCTP deaminase n=1 Tax=Marinobacter nauticus TaxID=2743 RepID=UPI0035142965
MAEPAKKYPPLAASNDSLSRLSNISDVNNHIRSRQSRELVVGLCGPIGSGIHGVSLQLQRVLKDEGYEVVEVRVSELIERYKDQLIPDAEIDLSNRERRYESLMDAGNSLREKYGPGICANLAISEISQRRDIASGGEPGNKLLEDSKREGLKKTAYVVDQLKHPEEFKALKGVYSSVFYLIGVLCDEQRRELSLTKEGIEKGRAHDLIVRDKKDNIGHGQQLEKTLYNADFYINNSDPNSSSVSALISRFLKLIHGGRSVTPTTQEIGMYSAYSASMQSACLSRQVGAAILDSSGSLIATGRNDVPKFGGGLYSEDDNVSPVSGDYRCAHRDQRCHNDYHKLLLSENIKEIMSKYISDPEKLAEASERIQNETPVKSLIEYSRAIHAEMDALISIARSSKIIEKGSVLYTTTYPCHNCARHIIAAGIETIVYVEPYEKSLAIKLHDDALSHSADEKKVRLVPFQGISPSRYQVFFSSTKPEKDERGRVIVTDREDQLHVDEEYVDSYIDRETKVAEAVFVEMVEK